MERSAGSRALIPSKRQSAVATQPRTASHRQPSVASLSQIDLSPCARHASCGGGGPSRQSRSSPTQ